MPRGKNYVNNNKGMSLQAGNKKNSSMEPCFYGAGCTRKDCIYRHDADVPDAKKTNETCLAFLAGTCSFGAQTCKKRHPPKHEADRLRAKYKCIRCRFGDECKTNGCLFTHPKDGKKSEPVAFLEHSAFPPLPGDNGNGSSNGHNGKTSTPANGGSNAPPADGNNKAILPGSAWRAAPVVTTEAPPPPPPSSQPQLQQPPSPAISAQAPAWFPGNPQEEDAPEGGAPSEDAKKASLNINAKAWVPPSV
mmetsp:Transcript_17625/g.36498  ORF Transcript_17625/g.36498 Transcript_17625/m.36498 type:complete len:248 (-) Transcript_17625:845-1588(-)